MEVCFALGLKKSCCGEIPWLPNLRETGPGEGLHHFAETTFHAISTSRLDQFRTRQLG